MASHGPGGRQRPTKPTAPRSAGRNGTSSRVPGPTGSARALAHARRNVGARGTGVDEKRGGAMRIERRYTKEGQSPYEAIEFRLTTSEIRNPDGSVVFHADDVEVPASWSQVASDVLAQKYFRKAGVPARLKKFEEETIPSWLWRSVADEEALKELP